MSAEFEVNPLTDADGCVELLYNFLWRKNAAGTTCPGLNVPDTVVYKYRQAAYWFFTSAKERGVLKRKNKINVVNNNVLAEFTKKGAKNTSGIVAYHIHSTEPEDALLPHGPHLTSFDKTEVEYFDEDGLKHFLFHGTKSNNGVLQRWVEPKGTRANTIRAAWSPQVCLLERRVARKPLTDRRAEPALRASTFDGEEHLSDASPLTGTTLAAQVQRVCNSIVEHVYESSGRKFRISRMCAHFRLDSKGKLWFLWCSSLRLASGEWTCRPVLPVNLEPNFSLKRRSRYLVPPRPKDLEKANKTEDDPIPEIMHNLRSDWFLCCYTGKLHSVEDRVEISYKFVILDHEARTKGEPEEVRNAIPPVLALAEPTLEQEEYDALRTDPTFLYKTCAMCTEASLQLNNEMLSRLEKENPASAYEPSWAPLPGGPVPRGTTRTEPLPPLAYPFTFDHNIIASGVYHVRDSDLGDTLDSNMPTMPLSARPITVPTSLYPGEVKPKAKQNFALAGSHPRLFNSTAGPRISPPSTGPLSPRARRRRPQTTASSTRPSRVSTANAGPRRPVLAGGGLPPARAGGKKFLDDTPPATAAANDTKPLDDTPQDDDAAEPAEHPTENEEGAAEAEDGAVEPTPPPARPGRRHRERTFTGAAEVLKRYDDALSEELRRAERRYEKLEAVAKTYRKGANVPFPSTRGAHRSAIVPADAIPRFAPVRINFTPGTPHRRYYAPVGDEASVLKASLNKDEYGILHRIVDQPSEDAAENALDDAEQAYLKRILDEGGAASLPSYYNRRGDGQ